MCLKLSVLLTVFSANYKVNWTISNIKNNFILEEVLKKITVRFSVHTFPLLLTSSASHNLFLRG